ncbi:uncharacterized protein BO97DRAFT_357874 [Aspergillus homomorphus CBS 101889]|uniref:Rootletin n=1 Tax=Aspergillus homomorphus (strain CBS 101889) TaxID=1450537 RepID=A0A395HG68_ASPHC|nr:hypothetical protein BO97DRAFT_357874 [Aspergillus homomorphus CBS 101889]RAL06847.1 hypothetical protein BO97DRAFT_357874 [Aspergillus homomorphus CBS 101889]
MANETPPNPTIATTDSDATFDEVEELLLLQMSVANDEPLSPQLRAVMATQDTTAPKDDPRESRPSPLLMERPRSSGIDLSSFSFAKPMQGRQPFSLQASATPSSSTATLHKATPNEHKAADPLSEAGRGSPRLGSYTSQNRNVHGLLLCLVDMTLMVQLLKPTLYPMQTICLRTASDKAAPLSKPRGCEPSSGDRLDGPDKVHAIQNLIPQKQLPEGTPMAQLHRVEPESGRLRVSKRRRSSKGQHPRNVRPSHAPSEDNVSSLSEEHLFQLLNGRIRDREENEVAAVEMKQQLEASISGLTEENQALKSQLEISDKLIRRRNSEMRAYKTQIDAWKSKLSSIKSFLNQLGSDFQTLRGDASRLLAAKKSAENERSDIDSNISDVRAQVARVSETANKGRVQVLRSENQIDLLKQALSTTEEKTRYVLGQLADEKKRTRLLELYIQECSRTQVLKLGQIRADQQGILRRFETVFQTMSDQEKTAQSAIEKLIGPSLNKCVSTLDSLCNKVSESDTSGKECFDGFRADIARMESELTQLHSLINENRAKDASCMMDLNQQLLSATNQIADNSNLVERISTSAEHLDCLQEALGRLVPLTETLNCSVDALKDNEARLFDQMTHLEADLTETRILKNAEAAALESTRHELEKIQLKTKMQRITAESEEMTESLRAKDLENKAIQASLLEAESKTQEAQSRVSQLESNIAALRDEVKKKEIQVREELSRASIVAREQIKARYEQQHRDLLKDKADLAQMVEFVTKQLNDTKSDLVQWLLLTDDCHVSNLESKSKEIEELARHLSDRLAELAEQEKELKRLAEQEASGQARHASLLAQLDEANIKTTTLEDDLAKTREDRDRIATELQHRLDALLQANLGKQEECVKVQEKLTAALIERADLESSKLKTKDEIYGLLKRVQDSELWVIKLKEILSRAGLAIPTDSLSETWGRLETVLLPTISNSAESERESHKKSDEPKTGSTGGLPLQDNLDEAEQNGSRARRIITTVPDSQATICPSPARRSGKTDNDEASIDSMCLLEPGIVPFSSIQQHCPPADCLFTESESYDLAAMLIFTPDKSAVAGGSVFAATPSKCSANLSTCEGKDTVEQDPSHCADKSPNAAAENDKASSRGGDRAPTVLKSRVCDEKNKLSDNRTKHRTVTFEKESPVSQRGKRKLSSMEIGCSQGSSAVNVGEESFMRSRRTYSKQQQESRRIQEKSSGPAARASAGDTAHDVTEAGTPRSTINKRTKVSFDTIKTTSQTKTVTEYFDRKSSPEKLASGSSRPALSDSQPGFQKKTSRGGRGSGRRSRGE